MIAGVGRGLRVEFVYRNHAGKQETRQVVIDGFQFGSNQYHPEPQFFLQGYCLDRSAMRSFAVKDIEASSFNVL